MYTTQCVWVLLALYVGLAHCFSWDIVLGAGKQLDFYNDNGTLTHTEVIPSAYNITSITYDPVNHRLLFADLHDSYYSLSSFDLATRKIQSLFTSKHHVGFIRIAYDPATQLLFWNDIVKNRISSILSKPGSDNTADENVRINFNDDKVPNFIAVDSCRGYIYWTTDRYIVKTRFDGSEREVILDHNVLQRGSLAIDQQTQKMYWLDIHSYDYFSFSIESANLKRDSRRTLYEYIISESISSFKDFAVSKDYIYWTTDKTIWQLTKNPSRTRRVEPETIPVSSISVWRNQGIASNYKIEDITHEIQNCGALTSLLPINSMPIVYDTRNDSILASMLCVYGTKISGEARCECTQGYIGERCDVLVCHNYCVQGVCSVSAEGQPKCRCNANYSGKRCDVNACLDYCLNNGVCSLNDESEPVCQCTEGFEGARCDDQVNLVKCFNFKVFRENLNTGKLGFESEVPAKQTAEAKIKKLTSGKTKLVNLPTELLRTQLDDGKEILEHNRMLRAMEMEDMKKRYEHNEIIRKLELKRFNENK